MFGAIIAGRPVYTNPQIISPTQTAFNIPSQPSFSHIVVFLLPGNVLPTGSAAAIYVQIPPADFKLLGAVTNDKQSAVFKVNAGIASASLGADDAMIDDAAATSSQTVAGPDIVIGISLEPLASVESHLTALRTSAPATTATGSGLDIVKHIPQRQSIPTKVLAQRIVNNEINFLSSFASGPNDTIPLKTFQDWWAKFEKKIELDPSFLEKNDP